MKDYVGIANQYIEDVLSGRIVACKWTKLACSRQKDDFARSWEYIFDAEAANTVCAFLELLMHVKGEKGGHTFVLEPWQCFCVTAVFGWKRKENGRRRFRRSVIFCGGATWNCQQNRASFRGSGLPLQFSRRAHTCWCS